MFTVSEPNLLLRVPGKLPKGLKLRTEEFQKGLDLALSMDTCRLRKKIHPRGWYFVKTADGSMSSGVGENSQQAIAGALRHALRGISEHCNAVDMKLIELVEYPWFFLARVGVFPYRMQKDTKLPDISRRGHVRIGRGDRDGSQAWLAATVYAPHDTKPPMTEYLQRRRRTAA